MTPTNDIPRVITEAPAGKSYSLTYAQKMRRIRCESIWSRDKVVEPYRYSKGKFV